MNSIPVLQRSLLALSWHSPAPAGLTAHHTGHMPGLTLCVCVRRHGRGREGIQGERRGRGEREKEGGVGTYVVHGYVSNRGINSLDTAGRKE